VKAVSHKPPVAMNPRLAVPVSAPRSEAINRGIELLRILRALPAVEFGRRRSGPAPLLAALRARGRQGVVRSDEERRRLRRLIRLVDRFYPTGGNCYRRALLELSLDPTSAREPLHLALRQHGGPQSGHAWLADLKDTPDSYDAVFVA
jgi:hypothetical protein